MSIRHAAMALLILSATPAAAQTVYRDSAGREIGTSRDVTMPGGPRTEQFYDRAGREAGSIVEDGFGGARVTDPAGRPVGSIDPE